MTVLAALILAQSPATAADFFPLVPGSRRVYEEKSDAKTTLIDEVGTKPAYFDGAEAIPVIQKNGFNQPIGTTYYRIDGSTVLTVGSAEDRSAASTNVGDTIDVTNRATRRNVLLQLKPAMPVFKYDGKETTWVYAEIPTMQAAGDKESIKLDPTSIRGTAKPGKERTVLGRKVETLEVRAEVQLGMGNLAEKIVETSVYGRGIGLVESVRKTTGGGKKGRESRMTLIAVEEAKKEGG